MACLYLHTSWQRAGFPMQPAMLLISSLNTTGLKKKTIQPCFILPFQQLLTWSKLAEVGMVCEAVWRARTQPWVGKAGRVLWQDT